MFGIYVYSTFGGALANVGKMVALLECTIKGGIYKYI